MLTAVCISSVYIFFSNRRSNSSVLECQSFLCSTADWRHSLFMLEKTSTSDGNQVIQIRTETTPSEWVNTQKRTSQTTYCARRLFKSAKWGRCASLSFKPTLIQRGCGNMIWFHDIAVAQYHVNKKVKTAPKPLRMVQVTLADRAWILTSSMWLGFCLHNQREM